MGKKSVDLQRLFGQLNTDYFCGRLPLYEVRFCKNLSSHGECDSKKRVIKLSQEIEDDPKVSRQTLIHEMCHHGCPDHGRRFLKKLERIAAMGEDCAKEELDFLRKATSWNHDMNRIKEGLQSWANDSVSRSGLPEFDKVRLWAAGYMGLSEKEVDEKLWLRASWHRAVREAKRAVDPAISRPPTHRLTPEDLADLQRQVDEEGA